MNRIFLRRSTLFFCSPQCWYSTKSTKPPKGFSSGSIGRDNFEEVEDYSKALSRSEIYGILQQIEETTLTHKELVKKFQEIRGSQTDIIAKWQDFMRYIVPVQSKILINYGISLDQFKRTLERVVDGDKESELFLFYKDMWIKWVDLVFGYDFTNPAHLNKISKQKMIELIKEFRIHLQSGDFLKVILEVSLSGDLRKGEKAEKILRKVAVLHKLVMSKYGFKGEVGFIECQMALIIDFFGDRDISRLSNEISEIVCDFAQPALRPDVNKKQ